MNYSVCYNLKPSIPRESREDGTSVSASLYKRQTCAARVARFLAVLVGRPAPFATSHIIESRGQRNEQQNKAPRHKNNGAAGYMGPVKIELRTDAGLLVLV